MNTILNTKRSFCESSLLGPFALLATTLIIIAHPASAILYLPLVAAAMLGIYFCKQWKLNGLILSLCVLSFPIYYQAFANEPFRYTGISLSLVIGLIITTLSAQEHSLRAKALNQEKDTLKQGLQHNEKNILQLQQQLSEEQQKLQKKNSEFDELTKEERFTREKLSNCSDQLHKEKKSHEFARALIKEQQQNIKTLTTEIEHLSRSKMTLEADLNKCLQESERQQKQDKALLEQYRNAIAQHQGERQFTLEEKEKLHAELNLLKMKINDADLQLQKALLETSKLELDKGELQKDRDSLLQKLEENRSSRRYEGLYEQLKLQFNEKSSQLDKTRQELFHTEEKLLALQQEWNELNLYDRDRNQQAIDRHLIKLDKEFSTMTQQYACEINALQDLVSLLMKGKNETPKELR